jgi:hypothetical protein
MSICLLFLVLEPTCQLGCVCFVFIQYLYELICMIVINYDNQTVSTMVGFRIAKVHVFKHQRQRTNIAILDHAL